MDFAVLVVQYPQIQYKKPSFFFFKNVQNVSFFKGFGFDSLVKQGKTCIHRLMYVTL